MGSAPHMREPQHLLSGALEQGQSPRLEIPSAPGGLWCARNRRMSESGRGPFSAPSLALSPLLVTPEALITQSVLSPLFAARSCNDRAAKLARAQALLQRGPWKNSLPLRGSSGRTPTPPCTLPHEQATVPCALTKRSGRLASLGASKRPLSHVGLRKSKQCGRKASTVTSARNLSACLSCPRCAPKARPRGQSFTLASFDEPGGRSYLLVHFLREYFE